MTESAQTQVIGADTLARTLGDAAGKLGNMQAAGTRAGNLVRTRAAGLAPVETGALARSIRASATGDTVEVTAGQPYAGYQEYGTATVPASPFMRPALDAATGEIAETYRDEIESIMGDVRGA
jgi:HK97 gp10 family phage protein